MSEPRLIGLGGFRRSGKDALADYLESAHDFVKFGMSDPLNDALLTLNPWVQVDRDIYREFEFVLDGEYARYSWIHEVLGYVEAKKIPEVRRLLQTLGTEVGRDMIDPDVWVKIARRRILEQLEAGRNVVLTAVRFPNEVDMINSLGGRLAWIDRSAELRGVSEEDSLSNHASENSVSPDMFHVEYTNNSSLEDLHRFGDRLMKNR